MDILWNVIKGLATWALYIIMLTPAAIVFSLTKVASKRYFFLDFFYGIIVMFGMFIYSGGIIFGNLMSEYIPKSWDK